VQTGAFSGFDLSLQAHGTAVVTFNEPDRLNAMTRATKRDLIESLLQAQMDDKVRTVVFTGTGRAFVAGDDVNRQRQQEARPRLVEPLPYGDPQPLRSYDSLRSASQLLNKTILHIDKITIAAINGYAIQSGLSLALACDFRLAADQARLGSATLKLGFLPDEGGHWLLVQHLGLARAIDFMLNSKVVTAQEALELGLVHEVVAADQLMARALELAAALGEGPQVATRLLKRAIHNAASATFDQACEDIATKTAVSDHHPDAIEGRAAFREKRPPRFNAWLADEP
jgi:2-(1,2-epoxy-1,2-dihydrophenyl)acetyl-CoA isomerase